MTQFRARLACGVGCSTRDPTDTATITNLQTSLSLALELVETCILHLSNLHPFNFFFFFFMPSLFCPILFLSLHSAQILGYPVC